MPLVPSNYRPPILFRNVHFATIYAGVLRKVSDLSQQRERVILPDGDFLDLDWSKTPQPTNKVAILFHGLEGDAQRHYMVGSAKKLVQNGFDTCAVNFRGCSGEPNRLYRSYHSGATEDVIAVLSHILKADKYTEIYLHGFSLGANLILKYLGEENKIPNEIKAAVAVSAPCDLRDACDQLLLPKNALYSARFKKHLMTKLKEKKQKYPEKLSDKIINSIVTLKDFDDAYTAPAHGFKDAYDYYAKCSCKPVLHQIQVPTLIINAKDDSFLGARCYPFQEANENPQLFLEVPDFGGHVGFWGKKNTTYTEVRAVEFFKSVH